jgi:hypothetical protein
MERLSAKLSDITTLGSRDGAITLRGQKYICVPSFIVDSRTFNQNGSPVDAQLSRNILSMTDPYIVRAMEDAGYRIDDALGPSFVMRLSYIAQVFRQMYIAPRL